MSMPWIKLYPEMMDDPKLADLTPATKWYFVELCLMAGECDSEGYIVNGNSPLTAKQMAWRTRENAGEIAQAIEDLQGAGLVAADEDGFLFVVNFAKRQGRPQSEKRKAWRERKRRQRAREQGEDDGGNEDGDPDDSKNCPESVTPGQEICLDSRRDKSRVEGEENRVYEEKETPCGADSPNSTPDEADDAWLSETRIVDIDSGDEQEPPEKQAPPADYLEAVVQHVESVAKGKKDWTRPPDAGGADDWANGPVDAFCKRAGLGGQVLPDKKRGQWAKALREVGQEWEAGPGDVATAIEAMLDDEHLTAWKSYSSPYQQGFKDDLGATIGALRMKAAGRDQPKVIKIGAGK